MLNFASLHVRTGSCFKLTALLDVPNLLSWVHPILIMKTVIPYDEDDNKNTVATIQTPFSTDCFGLCNSSGSPYNQFWEVGGLTLNVVGLKRIILMHQLACDLVHKGAGPITAGGGNEQRIFS